MNERTDGKQPSTEQGPKPIALASGIAMENQGQAAYRAYLDHRPTCQQCQNSLFICAAAKELWETYREARA